MKGNFGHVGSEAKIRRKRKKKEKREENREREGSAKREQIG